MSETFEIIAAFMWIVLAVIAFIEIRKWNKRFSDLYENMKNQFVDEEEA